MFSSISTPLLSDSRNDLFCVPTAQRTQARAEPVVWCVLCVIRWYMVVWYPVVYGVWYPVVYGVWYNYGARGVCHCVVYDGVCMWCARGMWWYVAYGGGVIYGHVRCGIW